jgi:hypothetical protein
VKVYLASRYSDKLRMSALAEELRSKRVEVTSRWLEEPHSPTSQLSDLKDDYLQMNALIDLEDIDRADVLVFFSVEPTQPMVRGGRHVEFGYALGTKKPIIVVGPQENIFHYLPQIERKSWPETVYYLEVLSKTQAHVKSLQLAQSETVK